MGSSESDQKIMVKQKLRESEKGHPAQGGAALRDYNSMAIWGTRDRGQGDVAIGVQGIGDKGMS